MQPCIVKQFNEHYNGYEVEHFVCQQEHLADYNPLAISKLFNLIALLNFVVMKYHVFSGLISTIFIIHNINDIIIVNEQVIWLACNKIHDLT